jgi:hypothetical protein
VSNKRKKIRWINGVMHITLSVSILVMLWGLTSCSQFCDKSVHVMQLVTLWDPGQNCPSILGKLLQTVWSGILPDVGMNFSKVIYQFRGCCWEAQLNTCNTAYTMATILLSKLYLDKNRCLLILWWLHHMHACQIFYED